MNARFTSAAETELYDAAAFYENAETGIGVEFLDAVQLAINKLEKHPTLGSVIRKNYRSFVLLRFPYKII